MQAAALRHLPVQVESGQDGLLNASTQDEQDRSSTPMRGCFGAGTRYFSVPGCTSYGFFKTSINRLICNSMLGHINNHISLSSTIHHNSYVGGSKSCCEEMRGPAGCSQTLWARVCSSIANYSPLRPLCLHERHTRGLGWLCRREDTSE